jgi:hypothetical protein
MIKADFRLIKDHEVPMQYKPNLAQAMMSTRQKGHALIGICELAEAIRGIYEM